MSAVLPDAKVSLWRISVPPLLPFSAPSRVPAPSGTRPSPPVNASKLRLNAPVPDHVAAVRKLRAPPLVAVAVFEQAVADGADAAEVGRIIVIERGLLRAVRGQVAIEADRLATSRAEPALRPVQDAQLLTVTSSFTPAAHGSSPSSFGK